MGDIVYYIIYSLIDWGRAHSRLVVALCGAGIIIAITSVLYIQIDRRGKLPVDVDVFPRSAQIEISDKGRVGRGKTYLKPGNYTYTVSAKGFQTKTGKLEVSTSHESNLYINLSASEGTKLSDRDSKQMQTIEGKSGSASRRFTEQFTEKYPIIKMLPVKDAFYSIGYLSDGKGGDFHLTVYTESPLYRNNALRRIRSLGENPSNYRIVFVDYKNPLTGGNQ